MLIKKETSVETEVEPKLTAYEKDLIYFITQIILKIQVAKKSTFLFFLFGNHEILLIIGEFEFFDPFFMLSYSF